MSDTTPSVKQGGAGMFQGLADHIVAEIRAKDAEIERLERELREVRMANISLAMREAHETSEVHRDAARWRMLPRYLEQFQIDYVGLLRAMNADEPSTAIDEVLCPNCDGQGYIEPEDLTCGGCMGKGTVPQRPAPPPSDGLCDPYRDGERCAFYPSCMCGKSEQAWKGSAQTP